MNIRPISDHDLLQMALGAGPDEVPDGWEALVQADDELTARWEEATRRAEATRTWVAVLSKYPGIASYYRWGLDLWRGGVEQLHAIPHRAPAAVATLGPGGESGGESIAILLADDAPTVIRIEVGERVCLSWEGPQEPAPSAEGIDAIGRRSALEVRRRGNSWESESWRLDAGEAPVILRITVGDTGQELAACVVVVLDAADG